MTHEKTWSEKKQENLGGRGKKREMLSSHPWACWSQSDSECFCVHMLFQIFLVILVGFKLCVGAGLFCVWVCVFFGRGMKAA